MSASPDRDILNIEEAANLLGVSVKTFNKVLHTQSIPARKIGREWKFSRQALITWIGNGRSDEFYRESDNGRGRGEDSQGAAGRGETARGGVAKEHRRTSGWRLELD